MTPRSFPGRISASPWARLGSDAAIEAADVVLMDDKPSKIALAMQISKRTLRIVRQNIVFALAVKIVVLALTPFGLSNMWEAVFADVGVIGDCHIKCFPGLESGKEIHLQYSGYPE